jgi:dihydropteroate synthase
MDISILSCRSQSEIKTLMRDIGVDSGGIEIMSPKAEICLVRVNRVGIFAANILKQEALSLGADTAVSKDTLTGKVKYTDCLIMGNLAQYNFLCQKLKRQPYGLRLVACEIERALAYYQRGGFILKLGRVALNLNTHTHIMGIMNLTPDSFSGDGLYKLTGGREQEDDIVDYAQKLEKDGADILDIGAESSRPGSKAVTLKEELKRLISAIKKIRKKVKVPISVDTYKSEVARQALDSGASIINDITALSGDRKMAGVISRYKAGVVLMHMQGSPRTMQKNPRYGDLLGEIIDYLRTAINRALEAGIDFEKIIVDPGIGFGKTAEDNLRIIKSLEQLKALGRPILIGTSRKSFLGKVAGGTAAERLAATISSNCLAAAHGARIVRVHDVKEAKQALTVLDATFKCP